MPAANTRPPSEVEPAARAAPLPPYLGLAVGVVAMSSAAVLIRLAEAPALVVASYRLGLAALFLLPLAAWRSAAELGRLTPALLAGAAAAAALLALHFAAWISSLDHTTVASSVLFVSTSPVFAALGSHFLLGESLTRRMALGVLLALAGGAVVAGGGAALRGSQVLGSGLALLGAVAMAGYLLITRRARARLSLLAYIALTYGGAAVLLNLVTVKSGLPLSGYPLETLGLFLALALIPQLVGHSLLNWAVGFLSATVASVAVLAEPVGASLLAALVLGELPHPSTVAGAPLILLGVYLVARSGPPVPAVRP